MSKQQEALLLALEALEHEAEIGNDDAYRPERDAIRNALAEHSTNRPTSRLDAYPQEQVAAAKKDVLSAVERHGLAEQPAQQQEPVVWMYVNRSTHETVFQKHMRSFVDHSQWKEAPLYGEPLANHELQCVCGAVWCGDEMVHLPDKRPPASKPWVGLTEEEIHKMTVLMGINPEWKAEIEIVRSIVRNLEAKLKEKNA